MALLGAPVFVVLSAYAMIGFYSTNIPFTALIVDLYNKFASNPLLYTIPIFTFAGYILAESKASLRMVNLSKAMLGWFHGGLAVVSLITCAIFTAFTGASGVTIIALGGLLFPALIKEKYGEKFSLGLLTSAGSLGLLFPPSLPVLIYCAVSESSVFQLFAAGFLPCILLIILLSIFSVLNSIKEDVPKTPFNFKDVVYAINEAKWELIIPFLLIVGIYGGFVTLGEIAAIIVTYSLFIEVFIYKDIKLHEIPSIITKSVSLVGGILIIMGATFGLTNYMVDAEIPMVILDTMKGLITSKFLFLFILNIFLLIVGCFLDIYSALLVTIPLILPISNSYGISPVHLGIIFLTNLEIGYLTPPVGINLFIASYRFNKSIVSLYRASIPFILILIIGLLIITYIPFISVGVVNLLNIK
ncbi:MAG: TRAP transporter large permease [Desulfobacterales bacterium]|nr:TRAP transporter large permease [Desulfobacterales bacterium]MBF0396039.1 TRAP transporter large permease [Desulfobacterales bacterium]